MTLSYYLGQKHRAIAIFGDHNKEIIKLII